MGAGLALPELAEGFLVWGVGIFGFLGIFSAILRELPI